MIFKTKCGLGFFYRHLLRSIGNEIKNTFHFSLQCTEVVYVFLHLMLVRKENRNVHEGYNLIKIVKEFLPQLIAKRYTRLGVHVTSDSWRGRRFSHNILPFLFAIVLLTLKAIGHTLSWYSTHTCVESRGWFQLTDFLRIDRLPKKATGPKLSWDWTHSYVETPGLFQFRVFLCLDWLTTMAIVVLFIPKWVRESPGWFECKSRNAW